LNSSIQLKEGVYDYAYGIASAEEIDEFNIYNATKLAMKRAINQLTELFVKYFSLCC
jgi:ribonuclease HII